MRVRQLSWEPTRRLQTVAILFWGAFLAITLGKFVLKPAMHTVYTSYSMCARAWWSGDLGSQDRTGALVARQYSPFFSELLAPFSVLPDRLGGALWFACSIGIFLSGFHRFLRHDGFLRPHRALAFLILPWIGMASIYNGQANILLAGCMLWAVCLCAEQRWWLGAYALAIPVTMKTYPIVLPMLLLVYYWRKLLLPFLIALGSLGLLPFLFHAPADVVGRYQDWVAFLVSGEQYALFRQVDVRTFLETWGLPIPHRDYMWIQALTGLFVLLCLELHRRRDLNDWHLLRNSYLLGSLWMVCFGPATEEATYLLASPAVAWILVDVFCRRVQLGQTLNQPATVWMVRGTLLVAALFAGPLQTSVLGDAMRRMIHGSRLAPLGLLLLLAWEWVVHLHPARPQEQCPRSMAL